MRMDQGVAAMVWTDSRNFEEKYFFSFLRSSTGGSTQNQARAICRSCGSMKLIPLSKHLPFEIIAKKFEKLGWKMKKGAICPGCQRSKKESVVKPKNADIVAIAPSPPLLRKAMAHIENCFDDAAGVYYGDDSDVVIAQKLEMSPASIIAIREKYFGPLKSPPEITAIKKEIEALTALMTDGIKEIGVRIHDLEARFR